MILSAIVNWAGGSPVEEEPETKAMAATTWVL